MKVETVTISPYFAKQAFKLILEVLFIIVLVYLLHTECYEIYTRKKELIEYGPLKTHLSTWYHAVIEHFWSGHEPLGNAVDLTAIVLGASISTTWLQVTFAMRKAEDSLQNLHRPEGEVAYDDTDHDVWSVYHHEVADTEHLVADVMYRMVSFSCLARFHVFPKLTSQLLVLASQLVIRRLAFFMTMLMIFLMFKTWDGIPAMQGVSATVLNASARLFSFGIILICLLTLFAGGAMLAFGQQMDEFHTFPNAFLSTLIVMTTGSEEIYELQRDIDPFIASVWHWLLVGIMYVVCLNLLLCILVDAYGESRAQHAELNKNIVLPSLYEQTVDTAMYCTTSVRKRFMDVFNRENYPPTNDGKCKRSSVAPAEEPTSGSTLIRQESDDSDIIEVLAAEAI